MTSARPGGAQEQPWGGRSFCCSSGSCCLTEPGRSNLPPRDAASGEHRAQVFTKVVEFQPLPLILGSFKLPRFLGFNPNKVTSLCVCVLEPFGLPWGTDSQKRSGDIPMDQPNLNGFSIFVYLGTLEHFLMEV